MILFGTQVYRKACLLAAAAGVLTGCAPVAVPDAELRDARMAWFRQARYGMFIHYGPFSQWYDRYWAKTRPGSPPPDLTAEQRDRWSVEGLKPAPDFARQWAAVAKAAGMKYMVFTAKHHEGFCLWDTKLTNYNSVKMGPGVDMVAEYVKACRAAGLKVGLYYSLWDHHHPDGLRCAYDSAARRRFLDYTQGLVRELMTRYGKIDMLWYDGPSPLGYAGEWEAAKMNAMVRRLQPGIVINNRSLSAEDFTCDENHISGTAYPGQDWEACMTFNGTWAWFPQAPEVYRTPRQIVEMLHRVAVGGGNLLLNVGPSADGARIGAVEQERLAVVGKWLQVHGQALYGPIDRPEALGFVSSKPAGQWTRKGDTAYLWLPQWPADGQVSLENVHAKVLSCDLLTTGQALSFQQTEPKEQQKLATRVTITGLPAKCPDAACGYAILRLQFDSYPR